MSSRVSQTLVGHALTIFTGTMESACVTDTKVRRRSDYHVQRILINSSFNISCSVGPTYIRGGMIDPPMKRGVPGHSDNRISIRPHFLCSCSHSVR
ncbi:hypothetical protein J6590_002045 [Homalodisca vitripennis]|nr:hypothetical protein J6590_002045 [Homalodisca vitripennis]